MGIRCIGILVVCILFLSTSTSQAAWTVEKEQVLFELISERIDIEKSIDDMLTWGYDTKDMGIVSILLDTMTEKQKQILLNGLVDTKVTHDTVIKDLHDTESSTINANNTELNKLKETP